MMLVECLLSLLVSIACWCLVYQGISELPKNWRCLCSRHKITGPLWLVVLTIGAAAWGWHAAQVLFQ